MKQSFTMFYRNWLDDKEVIDSDWPLSLGWKIMFYSSNKNFVNKDFYVSRKKINKAFPPKESKGVEGYACAWNTKRIRAVGIFYTGKSSIRFIELVTHEVSHIIDYIIEDTQIKTVDTELRAYLMDWMVGKILMRTKLNNYISKSKRIRLKKKKKGKK